MLILSIVGNYMKNWYILYHHERRFASVMQSLDRLVRYEVEYYMPLKECFVPRKDRKCLRQAQPKPLFPCYMFVCFDPEVVHTTDISAIDGAIGFVRFGSEPFKIHEDIIEELKYWPPEMLTTDNGDIELRNSPEFFLEQIHRLNFLSAKKLRGKINRILKIPDGHLRFMALIELSGVNQSNSRLTA